MLSQSLQIVKRDVRRNLWQGTIPGNQLDSSPVQSLDTESL